MNFELNGRTALVSGSTSGIGRDVAITLAEYGANVIVNGRSADKGAELVAEVEDLGNDAAFAQCDLTDPAAVDKAVTAAAEELGGIDIVVASGGPGSGPSPNFFRDTELEEFAAFTEHHYLNHIYVIKAALDYLIESDDGRVLTLSSDAGRIPTPGETGPGAAAAGVMMATRVMATEFSRWEISVNSLALTVIQGTELLERITDEGPISDIFKNAVENQTFPVYSDDVADIVLFFTGTSAGRTITGQTLSVTGGVSF